MVILGSILMLNTKHNRSKVLNIILGIISSVIIYYLNYFINLMGETERIPFMISIWTPFLLLSIICLIGLIRVNENKNFIIYTILLIMLFANYSFGEDFKFEAAEIKNSNEGNIIQSSGGVKIISNDNLEIIADKSVYDKDKSILKLEGNISVNDTQNNVKIFTNKINYFKKKK